METINIKRKQKEKYILKSNRIENVDFILLENKKSVPLAGWGRCRSCSCKGFEHPGNSSGICANCNHHFSQHV